MKIKGFYREIFRDSSMYLVFRIVSALIGLVTMPLIAHFFSAGEYGIYILIISGLGLYKLTGAHWAVDSLMRFFHSEERGISRASVLTTLINSLVLVNIVTGICFLALSHFFVKTTFLLKASLLVLIFSKLINYLIVNYFRACQRAVLSAGLLLYIKISEFLIGFPLFFIFFSDKVEAVITGMAAGELLLLVWGLVYFFRRGLWRMKFFSSGLLKKCLVYSLPLTVTGIMDSVITNSDHYIIMLFSGKEATGIYGFSFQLTFKVMAVAPQVMYMSFWPVLVKYFERQREYTLSRISDLFRFYTILSLPLAAGTAIFAPEIISLAAEQGYAQGAGIIPWVSGGYFFLYLNWFWVWVFMLRKKSLLVMYLNIVCGVVNIILNFLLIPVYGFYGAAFATFISYFLLFILTSLFVVKYERLFLKDIFFILRFIALIAGIVLPVFFIFYKEWSFEFRIITFSSAMALYIFCSALYLYRHTGLAKLLKRVKSEKKV